MSVCSLTAYLQVRDKTCVPTLLVHAVFHILRRQWFAVACIGALVDDDVPQLLSLAVVHALDAWVLIRYSPFANR